MGDLTKWPRLIVKGESVTPEQADVILVRTRYPWVSSNDKEWQREVEEALGLPDSELLWKFQHETQSLGMKYDWTEHSRVSEAAWKRLGMIKLNYLYNECIESSWMGGPHGWCDWDGTIGCATHNVGKWPDVEELTHEWQLIAETFPFLTLDCQVVTEGGEGELAAQWHVTGGIARQVELTRLIRPIEEVPFTDVFFNPMRERGVSIERLREAVARTLASLE